VKDVAAARDDRGITIQRVGVKDVHLPVQIRRKEGGYSQVLGRIGLSVELPQDYRGTHMSRFLEILFTWSRQPIAGADLAQMLREACEKLGAQRAEVGLAFKYFLTKRAPVTGAESALDYDCSFHGLLDGSNYLFTLGAEAPVTSLCPCSKEIADGGAHSQRAVIRVRVRYPPTEMIWIEDLVALVEQQGSAQIYPLLKRPDEKFVTDQAFEHPKFVEDIVRDTVALLRADGRITWFQVECESFESIHNHSAFAFQEETVGS
jgi:GTP cyclohydrolase I